MLRLASLSDQTNMAIQFEVHERINRPVAEVFEYVSTWENADLWHPSISKITPMDDAMGEGASWSETWETTLGTTQDYEDASGMSHRTDSA